MEKFTFLVHMDDLEVGCVLLQAAHGCHAPFAQVIGTDHWFVSPKEGMEVRTINKEDVPLIKKMFKAKEATLKAGTWPEFRQQLILARNASKSK